MTDNDPYLARIAKIEKIVSEIREINAETRRTLDVIRGLNDGSIIPRSGMTELTPQEREWLQSSDWKIVE